MSQAFYTEKSRIRAAFERAAPHYDEVAVLQREVAQRMAERLSYIKCQPSVILDAGSGTGHGAAQLRQQYPQAEVLELDMASAMLRVSRQKQRSASSFLQKWFRPKTPWQVLGDIEHLPLADHSVEMIWSNLALHWVNEPDKVLAEFRRVLKPDGLLMFSSLGPDTLKELRLAFADLDQATHIHQFIDMHDLGDALLRSGFAEPVMDMEHITLTYPQVCDVLQDIKANGAHNATQGRKRGLLGKQAWQQIQARYEVQRQQDRLPATYEIVYGHAWKAPDKASKEGMKVIEFVKKPPNNTQG